MKQFIVLILSSLLFLTCSDEQITSPTLFPIEEATIGVKSKKLYSSLESNQVLSIEDFEYTDDLLHKKIYYSGNREMISHYQLFNHDNNGRLLFKLNYHNNINSPTGFILLDSTVYLYSANLLSTEKIIYPYGHYTDKYNFVYDGKYLIKKIKYHREELESVVTYEYEDGKLRKETLYDKSENVVFVNKYIYNEKYLIENLRYSYNGDLLTKISYSYNNDRKISLEKVDVIAMYLSIHSHIIKYEY